jgi:WD40 repeat protein
VPQRLTLWDVGSGERLWAADGGEDLVPVAFRPGNREVLLRGMFTLQLWDVKEGKLLRTAVRQSQGINCVALAPDGATALTGDHEGRLQVWDLASGRLARTLIAEPVSVASVVVSPDGKRALSRHAITSEKVSAIQLWDLQAGKPIRSFPSAEHWGVAAAFAPDGTLAICGRSPSARESYLVLWEVATGREVRRLDVYGSPVAFTPDGRRLVVLVQRDGTRLEMMEVASGQPVWKRDLDKAFRAAAFSADCRVAFTGVGSYQLGPIGDVMGLWLWDLSNGELLRKLMDPPWAAR